ncbi:MAG: outer membrane lipoprotein-sorting protein [Gammaproteobacteria bacterium]|nr:outer membrane lipoprotein-sorting protein [Gammaproteobacteria bacterium]
MVLPLIMLAQGVYATTPEEQGLSIAREMDKRDEGFKDSRAELIMTLKNKRGDESIRRIRTRTLEVIGDGDKSLTIFDHPADVKGTAFLSYTHAKQADDQWLYLPALKRVKRISSSNKSGPFMGSEFAYEDLASQEVDKYTYRFIREEKIDHRDSLVIERYPVYENSGYTRQIVWVDKEHYYPVKIEFYDRKNSLLKTLVFSSYHQHLNKFWRAHIMNVVNHQTGKSTRLEWNNYHFQTGLTEKDFDQNSLKRTR